MVYEIPMILPKTYGFPKPMKQYNFMGYENKNHRFQHTYDTDFVRFSWRFYHDCAHALHVTY